MTPQHEKLGAIDWAALVAAWAGFLQLLPPIATLLSIIWMCIRIYETKTVQGWLGKPTAKQEGED